MKEKWTEQMKNKLDGHQMTPPPDLWEGISKQMKLVEQTSASKSNLSKSSVLRYWYWAVAAALIPVVIGIFTLSDSNDNQQLTAKSENLIAKKAIVTPQSEPLLAPTMRPTNQVVTTPINKQTEPNEQQQEITKIIQKEEEKDDCQQEPTVTQEVASTNEKQTSLPDVVEPGLTSYPTTSYKKWSLGLRASNGLLMAANNHLASSNNMLLQQTPMFADPSSSTYLNEFSQKHLQTEIVAKHRLPIRFGLSIQYQLNNNIALLSGISYSYLESEFSTPFYSNTQKLQYLGVPIGVSWKFWSAGNFSLYVVGNALLEKCVSAKSSDVKIQTRPWQLSVNASAGAEYNITRQLGIYLEPSLGYYFDDHSSVEHYYKEHPLAPSIQFGLRLHLK